MQYVGNRNRARRLLSNIGGASAPLLPFTDTFVRADGDLNNGWSYTAGKWTISGNAAVGTPGLGANLCVNGDFEAGDVNWVKGSGWSIAGGMATRIPDASTTAIAQSVLTVGKWYQIDWGLVFNAGAFRPPVFTNTWFVQRTATGSYVDTGLCSSAAAQIEASPPGDGDIDNVSYREITLADTFCTKNFGNANVTIEADLTMQASTVAGIVMCLDSITNPQNFIIAYIDNNNNRMHLLKYVGGSYAAALIANTFVTYAPGRTLKLVKSGTDVSLFYNDIQINVTKTVSDAGIINNTIHGMFSTHPGNSFGNFTINP